MKLARQNERIREYNEKLITETAWVLFCDKGIGNTTINEIAKNARMTKNTVYKYFPTKMDIAYAVALHIWSSCSESLLSRAISTESGKLSPIEKIQLILEFYLAVFDANPRFLTFFWDYKTFITRQAISVEKRVKYLSYDAVVREQFIKALETGHYDGTVCIDSESPQQAYEIIMKIIRGIYAELYLGCIEVTNEDAARIRSQLALVIRKIVSELTIKP